MHRKPSNNKDIGKGGVQVCTLFLSEDSQTLYKFLPVLPVLTALQVHEDWEERPLSNQKKTLLHPYLRHKRVKTSQGFANAGGKFLLH